jgi:hypothetical protein
MTDQTSVLARIIAGTRITRAIVMPWSQLQPRFSGKGHEQQWRRMAEWATANSLGFAAVGTKQPVSEVRFWATP